MASREFYMDFDGFQWDFTSISVDFRHSLEPLGCPGYIYFDEDCTVVGTTSISPTSVGTGLLFGGSHPLPEDVAEALSRQGGACRKA